MVSNTSELLPEPETPVNTVSRRFGSSMLTSRRLFSRAPCTRIMSWLSAGGRAGFLPPMSGALLDSDHVARGVANCAVADAVGLLRGLLDDVGVTRLELFEGA